jgi:hypothetical protein
LDTECGPGAACDPLGFCVQSTDPECTSDEECDEGEFCLEEGACAEGM